MVDKITQSVSSKAVFEVPSFRTHTSSKSSTALLNSHINSRLFKAAPDFNQPLLQFVNGVTQRKIVTNSNKITAEIISGSNSERIIKIGQHLTKLQ